MDESKTQAQIMENRGFTFEARLRLHLKNAPHIKLRHGGTMIQPEQATIIYVTKIMGESNHVWAWDKVSFTGNNIKKDGSLGRNIHTTYVKGYDVPAYLNATGHTIEYAPIDMRMAQELGQRYAPLGTPTLDRTKFNLVDLAMVFPREEWVE